MAFAPDLLNSFKSNGRKFFPPHDPKGNGVCYSPSHGFLFSSSEGILAARKNKVKLLSLRPNTPSSSLQLNRRGTMLMETKKKTVYITKLHHRKPSAETVKVDHPPILKVAWHPTSNTHFAVLTKQRLVLYNVTSSGIIKEQFFPIRSDVVDFAFGDSSINAWSSFCVFLLQEDGRLIILTPVIPTGCVLTPDEFQDLQQTLVHTENHAIISKYQEYLDAFKEQRSTSGQTYYQWLFRGELEIETILPKIQNERPSKPSTKWSKLFIINPNKIQPNDLMDNLMLVRLSTQGSMEIILLPCGPSPAPETYDYLIQLPSQNLPCAFPFHIAQQDHLLYITSKDTLVQVDISPLLKFSNMFGDDTSPMNFEGVVRYINTIEFPFSTLLTTDKHNPIVGFQVQSQLLTGVLAFIAPDEIKIFQGDSILEPITTTSSSSLEELYKEAGFESFESIDIECKNLAKKVRTLFSQVRDNFSKVKYSDRSQCEQFFKQVRDPLGKLFAEFRSLKNRLKTRMTILRQLAEDTAERMDQWTKTFNVVKTRSSQQRDLLTTLTESCQLMSEDIEALEDILFSILPRFSAAEIELRENLEIKRRCADNLSLRFERELRPSLLKSSQRSISDFDVKTFEPSVAENHKMIKKMRQRIVELKNDSLLSKTNI